MKNCISQIFARRFILFRKKANPRELFCEIRYISAALKAIPHDKGVICNDSSIKYFLLVEFQIYLPPSQAHKSPVFPSPPLPGGAFISPPRKAEVTWWIMGPGLWPVQILILCAFISADIFNVTLKDFKSGNWAERPETFMRGGACFAVWRAAARAICRIHCLPFGLAAPYPEVVNEKKKKWKARTGNCFRLVCMRAEQMGCG